MRSPQKRTTGAEPIGFYSCESSPIKDNDNGERTPLTLNQDHSIYEVPEAFDKSATFRHSNRSRNGNNMLDRNDRNGGNYERVSGPSSHMLYLPDSTKSSPWKRKTQRIVSISSSILALVLCILALVLGVFHILWPNISHEPTTPPPPELFDDAGRYIFEDYDAHTPFSNFLPGLAGIYGKPLYAFFVNRGQAIASFGVESKQTPIMEFSAANVAYQNTPFVGFRTFIQGRRGQNDQSFVVEPFSTFTTNYPKSTSTHQSDNSIMAGPLPNIRPTNKRRLYSGENELQIQEIDYQHQLETNATYFILPEEDFGCLVRRTTISNLHNRQSITVSVLDGLAKMQPAGGDLGFMLKTMGRTLEGFFSVFFPYQNSITMPFFRLTTQPGDSDFVQVQERGHYCVSIFEGKDGNANNLLPIVYDTSKVFGRDTTLSRPVELFERSVGDIVRNPQYGNAKTSSCFAAVEEVVLGPGESVTISSFFGAADHVLDIPVIARRLLQEGFVQYKLMRTREVVRQITSSVETQTGSKVFDSHVRQMFLDNSLRGGIPLVLGDQDDNNGFLTVDEDPRLKVFHVFSRIHGDLERDYNDFFLRSEFFSQGPGSFRDVIQNRRNDVIFQPRIASFNVRTFLSFIQADGYEPFSVEAVVFTIDDRDLCDDVAMRAVGSADGHRAQREALSGILQNGPFRPGQLFRLMAEQNIFLKVTRQEFIDMVAVAATSTPMAVYEKGFWADHWTYYLDLIQSYLVIFPDKEEDLLFDFMLPYFFSPASVQPRNKKYVENLSYNADHDHIQQLDATVEDSSKEAYMKQFIAETTGWYSLTAHWQHDEKGEIFESSVYAKLFLLATIKFATRDPMGMGIEYEGGRPGWDDANNGLPGMMGSGMPESFELKALIQYLIRTASDYNRDLILPEELHRLFEAINENLAIISGYKMHDRPSKRVREELFTYWDNVATARETYREQTKVTFSGRTVVLSLKTVIDHLLIWMQEIDRGISRAQSIGTNGFGDKGDSGVIPSYFAYRVANWNRTGERNKDGHPLVVPLNMTVKRFPLFLEGAARQLKTVDRTKAREIYGNVRNSSLYDKDLHMYTLSASLVGQPIEIGRSRAFAPGWLENQSVWLHMSYKFYLQLLRHNMYDEFFDEVRSGGLLPFMDPLVYGRSLMECSSFIASSAFEDPEVRGRGFLGRLSGSTTEFLSMWTLMFIGSKPFYVDETTGDLKMELIPTLPAWFFQGHDEGGNEISEGDDSRNPTVSFKLFSSITVNYHNDGKHDLFGFKPSLYRVGLRDGSVFEFHQDFIPSMMADKIRRVVFVDYIDAYF
ncbi:4-alpha-glucanotransferase [Nitzschia inconspicua]|uniref:4-alpha-glucanotransferase n=1 Tax=Nitzschia inconspicua TaxID=303405 RepID=A0A9K3PRJ1_9STRA|nr:4-alpha-glucanotransferase [Nitzschia inconspicua]